ncbi:recombinase family protein [Paenibacillus naphthalenovorans]|uniref:recombinase family protein n=1 Tax=Paenibacillus naphthalenovorans TaxID=162209 RepID=UPI003D2717CE
MNRTYILIGVKQMLGQTNGFYAIKEVRIYCRVSSEDQQERETIENQVDFASKYCDLHKFDIGDWYKDDGVSGKIPLEERPDGKRLVEDAQAGKVKLVLIYNIKRLGRTARDILNSVYKLEQYGVKIRSMTEPFDTGDPHGRFILTVLAGVAELDRETTLETMWHGANRAARKGKWLGGIVPYGYFVNEDRFLEINEDPLPGKSDMTEASVIRLMYNLVAHQKYSTIQVADYFNALTIPPSYTKDGRKVKKGKRKEATAGVWTPGRIGNMIKNTTYKGIHTYGKRTKKDRELIERKVPAIVDEETWDMAQQTLRENQLECMKNAKRFYLLRGLIKCGVCGLTYHGTAYPGANRRAKAYYVCGGKTSYRGSLLGKCTSKNVPAEWIEESVWKECVDFINNPGDALQELAAGMEERKSHKESLTAERAMVAKSLLDKDSDKQGILDLFRKKIIGAADVERQLQEIMKEKQALEQRIKDLDEAIEAEDGLVQQFDTAESLLADLKQKIEGDPPFEVRREIVRALVREVIVNTITPDDDGTGRGRPQASVTARYSFSKVKVVPRTLVHAVFGEPEPSSKAVFAVL